MATALELSPQQWQSYIEANLHRDNQFKLTATAENTREELISRVKKAAKVLKTQFKVQRVILFGSLAHKAWFSADSDVDLAVEGLAVEDYWAAWKLVEDVIGDRPVDLVEIEQVSETLRQMIERKGIVL